MSRPRGGITGLTLAEVLVALLVSAIIGTLCAGALRSERGQSAAVSEALDARTAIDLAAELLAEEVGLAGSRPYTIDRVDLASSEAEAWLLAPQIVVHAAEGEGHRVSVTFIDERTAGPPALKTLTFEVAQDAGGAWQLYRRSGSASRQPLVAGVTDLDVVALIDGAGWSDATASIGAAPRPLAAVAIELRSGDARRPLLVELPNRPLGVVLP